jgi:L-lactate dehydrogenase
MLHIPRVAIVGTGFVGSTTAYALLMSGLTAEVVLIDRDRRRAEGHVHDLRDAEAFSHNTRVFSGEFGDCCSADITIITTGVTQASMKSRLDGLDETAEIVHGLVRDVAKHNPRGILLIASNPVDVLTYGAWKWSGLPPSQVIGAGTVLDTARFRRRLAERYGIASNNIHAHVIGEHGDSQIPVVSSARIAGVPWRDFAGNWNFHTKKTRWGESPGKPAGQVLKSLGPRGPLITELARHWCALFVRSCAMRTRC